MKESLLEIVPSAVKILLQQKYGDKRLLDAIVTEATSYEFQPEEIVPCIMAAYYAYQSADYPPDTEEEQKMLVFYTAIRAALKLLSYGKYKAVRTKEGWMRYS
ncbi:hypothetical protein MUG87_02220 [Ectobacillus sp. JY-23]|uniref:hypothetical protein n=1 Tax=Ectobacillus sp. JY-23 TaxID=2933872 RepID=UPI001FF60BBE|nr:hypothetical protein [Ectobacillus sp. JY-23]UOY92975.1 hypothetical protein MUG87_02220 [Ectobacillus sp. JY-23]